MKRILFLVAALFTLDVLAFGQGVPPLKVSTVDGTVKSNNIGKIVVTNGTLSISGTTATITISGGGGGSPGGSNTQVQYNNVGAFGGAAGFTFNGTSTITLGVAGTSVGAIAFKNATSGTVTLQPVTGALGTVTLSLPATTGTLTALGNTTTGSGSIVLATSPTLVTPALGTPSSATLTNATGLPVSTGISGLGTGVATALANAVNGASGIVVTGSSNQISETLSANNVTGLLIKRNTDTSPTGNYFDFQNAAGTTVAKLDIAGALTVTSCTGCGGSSGITVGTTTITSGTNTRVLFNNAGVVGEYAITGTGNVAMSASPTFTGTVNAANAVLTTAVTTGTGATAGLNVTANSLTTGNGVDISSSSATSGNLVKITSTSTAAASSTLTGLNIAMSGANGATAQTVTGASISVTNTNATSGTNVALTLSASGATTANVALNVTAGQIVASTGTITTSQPAIDLAQTWNNSGTTFTGIKLNVTNTASTTGSLMADYQVGGTSLYSWDRSGKFTETFSSGATVLVSSITNQNAGLYAQMVRSGGAIMWYGVEPAAGGAIFTGSSANAVTIGSGNNNVFQIGTNGIIRATYDTSGNYGLGTTSFGTSAAKVFSLATGTAPSTSPAGIVQWYSVAAATNDAQLYARNEAGEINRLTGLAARVSTQFDRTSSTALADVTGLTRNVEAGRTYAFTAVLYTTSNVAGGVKAAISGTATATSVVYEAEVKDGSTFAAMGTARATTLGTAVGDVTAVTAARITISGTIVVNAAGTLTVQFAQNASNGTASSVLVNSSFNLVPIG